MEKQKAPAFHVLNTKAELDAFVADKIAVVAFLAADDKDRLAAYTATAKALRNDYEFGVASSEALLADVNEPAVIMYKNFDQPQVTFDGAYTSEELTTFIKSNAFPLVGVIGPDNYQKYLERGFPLAWFFVDLEKDTATLKAAEEVAKDFKSTISFVKLDGTRWADHAKTFGLNGKTPGVVIEDREAHKNYVFPQTNAVTATALRAHMQGYVDKTLAPTVKSEEIPADNSGPVKVIVGKSFDSIVMDTTKDVLVEFYAPWCGHCKSLAPKYEKLGEEFADQPSIVIAKVDATENDTPVDIKGFPTIIFFPADNKENPITFDGDRTETAMAAFIREHASTLKGSDGGTEEAAKKPAKKVGKDEL
jgi:protein disulfide-isomerase A1